MRNKNTFAALSALAAALLSSAAFAQNPPPAAPQRQAPPAAPAAPLAAPASTIFGAAAAPSDQAGGSLASHRALLGQINETKARMDLRKTQAALEKMDGESSGAPVGDAAKKADSGNVLAALEQAKKEQMSPQGSSMSMAEEAPPITLLATFAMEGARNSYAEVKVGDLIVRPRVGERLPSGEYVRGIDFDYIEVSKSLKAKKIKRVYISASEAAAVYGGLGRSGQSFEAGAAASSSPSAGSFGAPSGLPPMAQGR